jgi:hypothetical protein
MSLETASVLMTVLGCDRVHPVFSAELGLSLPIGNPANAAKTPRTGNPLSVPNHHGGIPLQVEIPDHNPVLALNPSVGLKFPTGFSNPDPNSGW